MFKCRLKRVDGSYTPWHDVKARTVVEAVQELHDRWSFLGMSWIDETVPEQRQTIKFALVEVEGEEKPFISRLYHTGLYRGGGVRPPTKKRALADIAKYLEFTGDPNDLLSPGWEGEEQEWT